MCKLNASKLEKMKLGELKNRYFSIYETFFENSADLEQEELNELLSKMNEKIDEIQFDTKRYKSDILINKVIYFDQHEKSSSFGKLSFYSDKNSVL